MHVCRHALEIIVCGVLIGWCHSYLTTRRQSSEDDGQGGRRKKKKSIKEKIKEKLPGSHKHEEHKAGHVAPATTTTTGTHAAGTHEKKGFMEKIKEKLPGHHH